MPELVLTIGIQGAGKSTWVSRNLYHSHLRLNRDMLRHANRESILFHAGLAAHVSMVVDNTNPTRKVRARYIALAKQEGYEIAAVFFPIDPHQAIARNASRTGKRRVPDVAIFATYTKLEPPELDEGFDRIDVIPIEAEKS